MIIWLLRFDVMLVMMLSILVEIFMCFSAKVSMSGLIESKALLMSCESIQHSLWNSFASSRMLLIILIGSLVFPCGSPAQFRGERIGCDVNVFASLLLMIFVKIFFPVSSSVIGRIRFKLCSQLYFFGMGYMRFCC